jgi:hypothetical protein
MELFEDSRARIVAACLRCRLLVDEGVVRRWWGMDWGGGSYVWWAGGRKQHAVNQE